MRVVGVAVNERLTFEHVESRAGDLVFLERFCERQFIYDRSACGIYEERGFLHGLQLFRRDQMSRGVKQGDMERHEVGLFQQLQFRTILCFMLAFELWIALHVLLKNLYSESVIGSLGAKEGILKKFPSASALATMPFRPV